MHLHLEAESIKQETWEILHAVHSITIGSKLLLYERKWITLFCFDSVYVSVQYVFPKRCLISIIKTQGWVGLVSVSVYCFPKNCYLATIWGNLAALSHTKA